MLVRLAPSRARTFAAAIATLVLAACSVDAPSPTAPAAAPDAPRMYTYPSAIYRSHVEFGVPADANASDDLLLSKRQYYVSYNCAKGRPNWVSWDLNKTHFGDAPRSTSFSSDASLPSTCYHVVTGDYTNSGFDRGHQVRSEERTWDATDNKSTFLMTNIVPQTHDLNAGPWLSLEYYLQDLAQTGNKEIYVISGPIGSSGTLSGLGKVQIPTYNFKIAVIMPYGQGLANVTSTSSIQVLAVKMPNVTGISAAPWTNYKTTVDALESTTGYNFLAKLPDSIESYWEARTY
ncbi:DNA/RNA non-specific endonuclease [Longimicrobium sp.]|uniref:DNA/RNA non-specific endonuclease n=1 Tax=Longimicrobium sp. TaxID=2029185 RepID=UPI002C70F2B4|nr:DNA/RNA non-specific endonuclease [Longimicrobium sp.]HSU13682.1 DNA/RNA non-specific endonuclease [Longimicrobium sp.]